MRNYYCNFKDGVMRERERECVRRGDLFQWSLSLTLKCFSLYLISSSIWFPLNLFLFFNCQHRSSYRYVTSRIFLYSFCYVISLFDFVCPLLVNLNTSIYTSIYIKFIIYWYVQSEVLFEVICPSLTHLVTRSDSQPTRSVFGL